jgi:cysteine desulfuration protein SufE
MTTLATIEQIQSDFDLLDDWEDRYRYVIELGRQLPSLPAEARTDANKVRGCASQVWLTSTGASTGTPDLPLRFAGASDSHIVQGLIAILLSQIDGKSAREILAVDIANQFAKLGLKEHLTPQRSNGLASMIDRVRTDARSIAAAV